MSMWIGSPVLVCEGQEARDRLANINDQKYHTEFGTLKVDLERWQAAQQFEEKGWAEYWRHAEDDRNHEHQSLFDNYKVLPNHLGHILEVGCGPFTQTATILKDRKASLVTLLDPLLESYRKLPNCTHKSGSLCGLQTEFIPQMAESLNDVSRYDTVICINVLEHVMDAHLVLNNIHRALKRDGILVMGERAWDDFDPLQLYDVGHPIRVKSLVFDEYRRKFDMKYQNGNYFIGTKK